MGGISGLRLERRRAMRRGNIPHGLSGGRYGRLAPQMRQHPVWARAIARLMAARGYRSQSALIAAARKQGIHLRPNTLSDAMSATKETCPRLDTLETIAQALDVPLWALWCEEAEYHLFIAAQQARDRTVDAELFHKFDELTALLKTRQAPVEAFQPAALEQPKKRRQA